MSDTNRYSKIIERIFQKNKRRDSDMVEFTREEIVAVAKELRVVLPKNLGDLIYSFRYRSELPEAVRNAAPPGMSWVIQGTGRSRYRFFPVSVASIRPSESLAETKVPDATPGVIEKYALSDEQALLAKLRYNRLVDVFTGVTCYSLQSHLRTTVKGMGQVETDELYVGLDRRGAHYIVPVQAKGGRDKLNVVQIEQDFAICEAKFPALICRPIGAQFIDKSLIALFEFEKSKKGVAVGQERHYRLVPAKSMTEQDLALYRRRALE